MMLHELLMVIGVAILAAAVQGGTIYDHSDPTDEIAQSLHRFEIEANKELEKINTTLANAEIKLKETGNKVEKEATAVIQSNEGQFKKELDKLKKEAAHAKINIDDCLKGNEEKLEQLPSILSVHFVKCFSDSTKQDAEHVLNLINETEKLRKDIDSIKKEFENCKTEKNKNKCLLEIAYEIKKGKVFLIKIEKDAADDEVFIPKLEKQIEACGVISLAETKSDLKKIVDPIVTCIDKKLHH